MKETLGFLLLTLSINLWSGSVHASLAGLPQAAKEADRSATLNLYGSSYPKTLNPVISSTLLETTILDSIFESLMIQDLDTGEIECYLCTEYKYSKDKKSVTFTLRRDAKFHDGKPLTAEDVIFSFKVYMHPKVDNLNRKSPLLATVKRVEKLGKYKLKVYFKAVRFNNIIGTSIYVIPRHRLSYFEKSPEKFNKDQKFGRNPMGSGPYRFKKWRAGKYVEIVRNDDWWGFKDPRFKNTYNFKKVRFKIVTNDNVAIQAFRKGEFDFMGLASYNFTALKEDLARGEKLKVSPLHFIPKISTSFMFISWNSRKPKFKDAKTRLALTLLTNRFEALKKFSKGLRPPTNGPWGINSPFSCPEKKCPVPKFDPKKAQKLLAEAGWRDSDGDGVLDRTVDGKKQKLSFSILASQGDYYKNVLGVYMTEMKKAGIDVKAKQMDWTALIKQVDDLKFDSYFSGFSQSYPISPRSLWHSSNTKKTGSNSWNFVSKEADKLIDQFEKEFDTKKRQKIGQKIHEIIYREQPVIFHHEGGGCYFGINKKLKGVTKSDYSDNCLYWPRWYKAKK